MSTSKRRCPVSGPSGVIYTPDRTDSFRGHEPDKQDRNRTISGQKPDNRKTRIPPSPRRAIRLKCLDCCLGSSKEVELCPAGIYCSLSPYRQGHRPEGAATPSPIRIIRQYCLQCGEENSYSDVEACPIHDCPFFLFRMGKNPNRTGRILDEEQKAILRERIAEARAAKMPKTPNPSYLTGLPADPIASRVDFHPKTEAMP